MQTIIKEYGHTLLQGAVFVLVIILVFAGLSLIGSMGRMTNSLDGGIIRAEAGSGEASVINDLQTAPDNIAMSGNVYVCRGERIYFEGEGGSRLIGLKNGNASRIHINSVHLLRGETDGALEYDYDGYDVTDQALTESADGNSYLCFKDSGNYRLVVSVTDANSVVSCYHIFVHVGVRRRGA